MRATLGLIAALLLQDPVALRPEDPESPVHPRKFGSPGGVGISRGWYVWLAWHPETGLAEVRGEGSGESFTVRVLPWMTTYRHLAYGASPDDLLPGERVNMFFNPEGGVKRAYLVHYQDEIGQMKGHQHAWQVEEVVAGGRGFTARVMHGDKVFDANLGTFDLDGACRIWRDGKVAGEPGLSKGERLFLTWCYDGSRRVVKLMADGASLDALQGEGQKRVRERIARDGMGAFVEAPDRLLIFSTYWAQAAALKPGQTLRLQVGGDAVEAKIVSRKNLGAYGSGPSEIGLEDVPPSKAEQLKGWLGGKIVRVFVRE